MYRYDYSCSALSIKTTQKIELDSIRCVIVWLKSRSKSPSPNQPIDDVLGSPTSLILWCIKVIISYSLLNSCRGNGWGLLEVQSKGKYR